MWETNFIGTWSTSRYFKTKKQKSKVSSIFEVFWIWTHTLSIPSQVSVIVPYPVRTSWTKRKSKFIIRHVGVFEVHQELSWAIVMTSQTCQSVGGSTPVSNEVIASQARLALRHWAHYSALGYSNAKCLKQPLYSTRYRHLINTKALCQVQLGPAKEAPLHCN